MDLLTIFICWSVLMFGNITLAAISVLASPNSSDYSSSCQIKNRSDCNNNETVEIISLDGSNAGNVNNSDCISLANADHLGQTELIKRLTLPCRYDRFERPQQFVNGSNVKGPVDVYVRVYIYVLENLDTSDLQFTMHGLVQLRYADPRLNFAKYSESRSNSIKGESELRNVIWTPHIFLANEQQSSILGTDEKDIRISITPDGQITLSSRIQATLFCWMDLKKFPFDEQFCSTIIESWIYNSSEIVLHWEKEAAITLNPKMHLTEFALQSIWTNESIASGDFNGLKYGAFIGNYSSLSFTVHLIREAGYYVMDYFLPSMMIVAISWVSFWLQADQTPARTTLGTTTMLSFITLASSQENNLPKVSYIKISEVWFLGCTVFIFGSLVEFAFVNTIWRRNRNLELKKINSKHILKSTLTPNVRRRKAEVKPKDEQQFPQINDGNFLTINNNSSNEQFNSSVSVNIEDSTGDIAYNQENGYNLCTMTPHEASCWIDRKARFVFPLTFLLFNAFFWAFVYCF